MPLYSNTKLISVARAHISSSLRLFVNERAGGRCEYCLIHQDDMWLGHQIDHVIPIAHGGLSDETNLALSCARCNLHKGSNLSAIDPISGRVVPLFNPRRQRWQIHFELEGVTIVGRTATGRASVRFLRLNESAFVAERIRLQAIGRYPRE